MKQLLIGGVILAAFFSGESMASCADSQVTGTALTSLINGNTVCASLPGGDKWQEQHRTNSELWDYKKGPSDPVDPTERVGTWSIGGRGSVTYMYTGGGSYTYQVHGSGSIGAPHSFCDGGTLVIDGAIFESGEVGCFP